MFYPKVSIITPSYNQGQFLEQTILSVLGQEYPNLEYIIIDGGSTDNSIEIIEKYEQRLKYWISEPDKGQSHAINKGFSIATGDILAWLNSDDMYLPGVLNKITALIDSNDEGVYFGDCIHFNHLSNELSCFGSKVTITYQTYNLLLCDYVIQPASFWTRKTWEKVGKLNEDSHYSFDWEWFIRAKLIEVPFYPISSPLAIYRIHDAHKTGTGGIKRQKEISEIYGKYNPNIRELYDLLTREKIIEKKQLIRLSSFLLRMILVQPSLGLVLKLIKFFKYYKFTIDDINQTIAMI